jgi:Uma2 family endonuclease
MSAEAKLRLFSADEYARIAEAGIFSKEERPQLIEGKRHEVTEPADRLLTVDEYHHIANLGIFDEDGRLELIEGEIIEMPPIGSHHASTVGRLNMLLTSRTRPRSVSSGHRIHSGLVFARSPSRTSLSSSPGPISIVMATPSPMTCCC